MREYSIHNLHCVCVYDILKEKKKCQISYRNLHEQVNKKQDIKCKERIGIFQVLSHSETRPVLTEVYAHNGNKLLSFTLQTVELACQLYHSVKQQYYPAS